MIIMIFRRVQYGKTINQGLAPFNGHTSEYCQRVEKRKKDQIKRNFLNKTVHLNK